MAIDFRRWPDALPLPQISTHALDQDLPMIETNMADGTPVARAMPSNAAVKQTATLVLTGAQHELLVGCIHHLWNGGARWFTFPTLIYGSVQDVEARFTGSIKTKQINVTTGTVTLSCTFLIRRVPVIDENTLVSRLQGVADAATQTETALDDAATDYVTE
jgi:hypothetical protein